MFSAEVRWSITVFHCLNIAFDGVNLYQNIQLNITEGESSECLLVWHRRAAHMGTVRDGSRRSIIDQRCEGWC